MDSYILKLLSGGDRRSIGKVEQVVGLVGKAPTYFDDLFRSLSLDDELIRMRAMDAIEKITREHKTYLKPYKKVIVNTIALYEQQEVKWHVAQIIPRLNLTLKEKEKIYNLLVGKYLEDKSSIVKTCAMQALADLSDNDIVFKGRVLPIINSYSRFNIGSTSNTFFPRIAPTEQCRELKLD